MPDLRDGERRNYTSSSGRTYELYNAGGVYSCSCPAWRNQSRGIDERTCKHLRAFRGAAAEAARIGGRQMPGGHVMQHPTPTRSTMSAAQSRASYQAARNGVPSMGTPGVEPPFAKNYDRKTPKPAPVEKPSPATVWSRLLDKDPFGDDPPPVVVLNTTDIEKEDAFAVLLAETWDGVLDPTGYLMSEKLDGVRAYWDGECFRSRADNVFYVPKGFCDMMPKGTHLDGEFWMGRGRFQETSGYVRRHDMGTYWSQIQYRAFDLPNVKERFVKRYDILKAVTQKWGVVKLVEHQICRGIPHVKQYLAAIEKMGGEGLMLRRPDSFYVPTRNDSLLKVKSFYDAEATIVGYTKGKGKYKGQTGALECVSLPFSDKKIVLSAGVAFNVGTGLSDADRRNPPPIGSRITFRFLGLTNRGVPRHPSYVGRRNYE